MLEKGDTFGRLTVIELAGTIKGKNSLIERKYLCVCECSNEVTVREASLKAEKTRSCGCLRQETAQAFKSYKPHSTVSGKKRQAITDQLETKAINQCARS